MSAASTVNTLRAALIAGVSGVVFATGLALGGMLDPRKVQGFLDVGGIASGRCGTLGAAAARKG